MIKFHVIQFQKFAFLLLCVTLCPWHTVVGQVKTINGVALSAREIDAFIVKEMESRKIPGLSLAIINDDSVVYQKGYGVKNAADNTPVDTTSLFEAASLSKPVFAYAFLKLVERGQVALDTPLYKYLENNDVKYDDRYKLITARMALSHTSGFPNWRWNNKDKRLDIKFTPGERFSYSGEGYKYLGQVMQQLTGKDPEEVVREEVFVPLGMEHSYFRWNDTVAALTTTGHNKKYQPREKWKPDSTWVSSGLHTTAGDYARFLLAIIENDGLSEATILTMLAPQIKFEKKKMFGDSDGWGLGFGVKNTPYGVKNTHFGVNDGFQCYMEVSKEKKMALVFFTNSDAGLKIADDVIEYVVVGKESAKQRSDRKKISMH